VEEACELGFLLQHSKNRETGLSRFVERGIAVCLMLIASPLFLVIAALVWLSSRGNVFYTQTRLGLHGRTFQILKFRSMKQNAEAKTGAVWCTKGDSRVTVVGKLLRFSHLDELPQLWNIARGEMSFVGPRPERPEIAIKLEKHIPRYWDRLSVFPGVTGLAQINLDADESIDSVKRKFELDIEYVYSASPLLDLQISVVTVLKMAGVPKQYATQLFALRRVPSVNVIPDPVNRFRDYVTPVRRDRRIDQMENVAAPHFFNKESVEV